MCLVLVKFLAGVNDCRRRIAFVAHELYDFEKRFHAVNLKIVYDSRFPSVLFRHNQSLKVLCSGSDSYRQGTFDRLERTVKAQLAYHHVLFQMIFGNVVVGA